MMKEIAKKCLALEIYQEINAKLTGVADKSAMIDLVNQIIQEKGLASEAKAKKETARLEATPGSDDEPISCPHCGGHEAVRPNGSSYGKKRYICAKCQKSFGSGSGRLQHGTKSADSSWDLFLAGSVQGDSLEQLAEKCAISLATAHSWRLRVYQQVANSELGQALQSLIQTDDFKLAASFKGNKSCALNLGKPVPRDLVPDYIKYGFRDHAHARGRSAEQPDPSHDNEEDHSAAHSQQAGSQLAQYNLQLLEALHLAIAELTQSRRSFSSKHSELYIIWQSWLLLNQQKPVAEKVAILKRLATAGKRPATVADLRTRELADHIQKKKIRQGG